MSKYLDGVGLSDVLGRIKSVIPTVDATPTSASTNAVSSGGVYTAIQNAIGSVYRVKGSKATYANLPSSGNVAGDVWNVEAAYGNYAPGTNWVWTGTTWDALGGTIDLSAYQTTATADSKYVTALGTSGNNLTWTKNGTTNNVTVPFATKASQDGNGTTIASSYLKLAGGTMSGTINSKKINLGEDVPVRTNSVNTAPKYGHALNMRGLTGYIEGLKVNSAEGDYFYCVDRNSDFTVTSNYKNGSPTVGEYSGSDLAYLFDLVSANRFMLYCPNLETTPWVLTIMKNSGVITATDVLDLWFFQTGNVGYLNSYKIEVYTSLYGSATPSEWYTVVDRDNVNDRLHEAVFPIWCVDNIHGANSNYTYGYISGVRITIRKADPTGTWSANYLPICAVQLRDRRPSHKPSAGIGAMDMRGGTFYGDVIFDYGELRTKTTRPVSNNEWSLGNSSYRWKYIYGNEANFSGGLTASSTLSVGGNTTIGGSLSVTGLSYFNNTIYANRYNGLGNVAGAAIVINKGANYFGIGASSTTLTNLGFGTTSNVNGTWSSLFGEFTNGGNLSLYGDVIVGTSTNNKNTLIYGSTTANSFIKSGGTSSQFLKADGSVDSTVYATNADFIENEQIVSAALDDIQDRLGDVEDGMERLTTSEITNLLNL